MERKVGKLQTQRGMIPLSEIPKQIQQLEAEIAALPPFREPRNGADWEAIYDDNRECKGIMECHIRMLKKRLIAGK